MTLSWVDGRPAQAVAIHDRGLAYGDGLFETIRVVAGRPRLFQRHLQRLEGGCRRLAIPCELSALGREILDFSAALENGVAKLILTRGDGLRGYGAPRPCQPRRLLLGAPWPVYPPENAQAGVRLFPCATRLAEQPLLAGLKHLNRLEQVLARGEWQAAEYAEGLMCDTAGRVIEGVFSNLFLVRADRLATPALDRCGVAGVMRGEIIDLAQRRGIAVEVRDISREELFCADEVFLCNSQYGIWPVRELQGHTWPVGALTRTLQAIVAKLPSDP